jgi:amino acid permease
MAPSDVEKGTPVTIAVEHFDKSQHTEKDLGSSKDLLSHKYDDEVSYGWFLDSFRPKQENNEEEDPVLLNILTSRHIQMIAIGGSIGSGLFIGSGGALSTGGPAMLITGMNKALYLKCLM